MSGFVQVSGGGRNLLAVALRKASTKKRKKQTRSNRLNVVISLRAHCPLCLPRDLNEIFPHFFQCSHINLASFTSPCSSYGFQESILFSFCFTLTFFDLDGAEFDLTTPDECTTAVEYSSHDTASRPRCRAGKPANYIT